MKEPMKIKTTIALLALAITASANADLIIPVDLGPDRETYSDRLYLAWLGKTMPAGPTSVSLIFDKPIYVRGNSGFSAELGFSLTWFNDWVYSNTHLRAGDSYILDAEGHWISLGFEEIGGSPFGALWLTAYINEPTTLYGLRFDFTIPALRFARPVLQNTSHAKPFEIGGRSVPDTASPILLLGLALVGLLGFQINKPKQTMKGTKQ